MDVHKQDMNTTFAPEYNKDEKVREKWGINNPDHI